MTEEDNIGTSPIGLVRYVQVHAPATYTYDGNKVSKPQYSVTMIFDKKMQATPAYKAMEKAVEGVITKAFGKRTPPGFVHPIKNCEDNVKADGTLKPGFDVDGGTWMKFLSQYPIECLNPMGEVVKDVGEIEALFYPGCEARVVYMLKAFPKGVSLFLLRIQKGKNGPRMGGGSLSAPPLEALDIGEDDPMAD